MAENQESTDKQTSLPADAHRTTPEINSEIPAVGTAANGAAVVIAEADQEQQTALPRVNPVVVDYAELWKPLAIKRIVMADYTYIVYLGENDEMDWQTTAELDVKLDNLKDGQSSVVLNRAAEVSTMPTEHLTPSQRLNFRIMTGEGIARLFELRPKSALEMLNAAAAYATARNQEIARGWQLKATGATAGMFVVLACVAWLLRGWLRPRLGDMAFILLIGACAGAVGALFSILTRLGSISLDPSAGKVLHQQEGCARILAGSIGAVIAVLAVHLSLILGMLTKLGHPALIFIAIIAGTSERLVPAIIKKTEGQAESEKKTTP